MPRLDPRIIHLRVTSVVIVQTLMDTGRYISERDALEALYHKSRQKHQPTGFRMTDFRRFWQSYRKFKTSEECRKHLQG